MSEHVHEWKATGYLESADLYECSCGEGYTGWLEEQLAQARALLREFVAAYRREQTDEELALELYELVEKAKEAGGE